MENYDVLNFNQIIPGCVVASTQGKDLGELYIVLDTTSKDRVLLINGHSRPIDKPKTKNIKHVKNLRMAVEIDNKSNKQINNDVHSFLVRHKKMLEGDK